MSRGDTLEEAVDPFPSVKDTFAEVSLWKINRNFEFSRIASMPLFLEVSLLQGNESLSYLEYDPITLSRKK